jgi:hypothetical protein
MTMTTNGSVDTTTMTGRAQRRADIYRDEHELADERIVQMTRLPACRTPDSARHTTCAGHNTLRACLCECHDAAALATVTDLVVDRG